MQVRTMALVASGLGVVVTGLVVGLLVGPGAVEQEPAAPDVLEPIDRGARVLPLDLPEGRVVVHQVAFLLDHYQDEALEARLDAHLFA